ncbi:NmrA family NAD(P)-binding protein [Nonomuraea sp. NPDC059194]|uniref:NmrA family NAD(P)-binding protein n=1 Tax=Nonomuraea sp. NPDC059194 TaxID=3346764 RepID=UPI00367BF1CB
MNVLVIGATGAQGGATARRLVSLGHAVSGLSRTGIGLPDGVKPAIGDLADAAAVRAAFDGVTHASVLLPMVYDAAIVESYVGNIAAAAAEVGLRRLVFNTGNRIPSWPTAVAAFETRRAAESALAASGVPTVVLRPPVYLDNLSAPWVVEPLVREGVLRYPLPAHVPVSWLSHDDLATATVAALTSPDLFPTASTATEDPAVTSSTTNRPTASPSTTTTPRATLPPTTADLPPTAASNAIDLDTTPTPATIGVQTITASATGHHTTDAPSTTDLGTAAAPAPTDLHSVAAPTTTGFQTTTASASGLDTTAAPATTDHHTTGPFAATGHPSTGLRPAAAPFLALDLSGPDVVTGPELAAAFATVLGHPVRYEAQEIDEFEAGLALTFGPSTAGAVASTYRWVAEKDHTLYGRSSADVESTLGVRLTRLRDWIASRPWKDLAR